MGNIRPFDIIEITNKDSRFYKLLGPFLAKREIIKALGEPIYDDDDKHWFVALNANKEVMGFAAARATSTCIQFSDSYTLPAYRKQGVFAALVDVRLEKYSGQTMRTIANENSVKFFSKKGFVIQRETVNYYFMEKAGSNEKSNSKKRG